MHKGHMVSVCCSERVNSISFFRFMVPRCMRIGVGKIVMEGSEFKLFFVFSLKEIQILLKKKLFICRFRILV